MALDAPKPDCRQQEGEDSRGRKEIRQAGASFVHLLWHFSLAKEAVLVSRGVRMTVRKPWPGSLVWHPSPPVTASVAINLMLGQCSPSTCTFCSWISGLICTTPAPVTGHTSNCLIFLPHSESSRQNLHHKSSRTGRQMLALLNGTWEVQRSLSRHWAGQVESWVLSFWPCLLLLYQPHRGPAGQPGAQSYPVPGPGNGPETLSHTLA